MSIVAREWLSVTFDESVQASLLRAIIVDSARSLDSGDSVVMLASMRLPDAPGFRLDAIATDDQTIRLTMTSTQPTAACPVCADSSAHIHSRYQRTVRDLPWAGHAVRVQLAVRRF